MSTAKERYEVRLQKLGIDYDTAQQLRRDSNGEHVWQKAQDQLAGV